MEFQNITNPFDLTYYQAHQFTQSTVVQAHDLISRNEFTSAYDLCLPFAQREVEAIYLLGLINKTACDKGQFQDKFSYSMMICWFELASAQGHLKARFELGKYYFETKNYKKARDCFNQFSTWNLTSSAPNPNYPYQTAPLGQKQLAEVNRCLGILCHHGLGGKKNEEKACVHFKMSIVQGDPDAFKGAEPLAPTQQEDEVSLITALDLVTERRIPMPLPREFKKSTTPIID